MHSIRKRRPAGFTLTEIVVVMGICGVLASIIFPALAQARSRARVAQCSSQLRQLGQALTMYDIDHDRQFENYPDRLTHLHALGYARDPRIFVCPNDYTRAQTLGEAAVLKPGNPIDTKYYWAERFNDPPSQGMRLQNCSYLYEFSTRDCQSWQVSNGKREWVGSGFGTDALVGWYSEAKVDGYDRTPENTSDPENDVPPLDYYYDYLSIGYADYWDQDYLVYPPDPIDVDRDLNFMVSWQEAKFWQLANGDVYITGEAGPGEMYVPAVWSSEPYMSVYPGDEGARGGYPRTWLPIVRCFWHCNPLWVDKADEDNFGPEEVLNLAIDGNLFYSVPGWEQTAWKFGRQKDF
ncbi:MAG TPA: type II secretion system protein [Planctomycetota bacterium]|nr:type II secretion system protein [Planctomycetota bacterium]